MSDSRPPRRRRLRRSTLLPPASPARALLDAAAASATYGASDPPPAQALTDAAVRQGYRPESKPRPLRELLAAIAAEPPEGSYHATQPNKGLLSDLMRTYDAKPSASPPLSPAAEHTLADMLTSGYGSQPTTAARPAVRAPSRTLNRGRRVAASTTAPVHSSAEVRLLREQQNHQRQTLTVALRSASHMETMCALLEEIAARDREHAEREARSEARAVFAEERETAERERNKQRESQRDLRELFMLGLTAGSMIAAVFAIFAG